ncbi:PAS domain S-box protein [Desulfobacula sp.]|uniref:PAS domain S-box protein n=1 Tax=Desulfobacula sp. TaxID=2593537 RepID=UPI0025B9A73C|nr:PAS domain S-box protein [Desulfobacula sp.]MBC2705480.1 PAS domain S-box protein [Desulfobacula sp.]
MIPSTIIGFINNAALLLALGLLYDILTLRQVGGKTSFNQMVTGVILGGIGIAVMSNPWEFTPGVIFDTRSILLCITGFFFGTLPVIMTILITGAYRLFLGGEGVWTGLGVIATSGLVGLAWRHKQKNDLKNVSMKELYALGMIVHVLMLLWMLTLPWPIAKEVLSRITLPVLLIFPVGTALLGQLMKNRHANKLAKMELKESEEKYRELADSLPQSIFEIDETGRVIYTNQTAFDLFKYTKDEFDKGINISQIIIPEDHDRALKNMQSILNGIQLGGIEYTALRHDGTTFPVVIHASLVTRNAKPIGLRGLLIDISDQKKMEEKLKKSEERYRKYFEDNIVGAYISSPGGKLIACNREYKKIFGFDSTQQALDTTISKIFEVPNERAEFLRLLKKKKRVTGYESKLRKINGTPVRMLENASGVFDEEGNLKRIRGFLMDVTEQRKLEAQLRQAQRMETIGTLAGGIAHDFNNILFPILGHTDMLLADIPEGSPLQDGLNEISAGALRAKDLVRQILTFSRQDTTELILMKMQPIVKEALKLIRSTIPTTIDITQDINANCGAIKADPTQLHQIIMNLTTNAYHAMEETGGVLSVSLKEIELGNDDAINLDLEPGTYVCLTIADTGTGMDKNIIEKIFDPFFTTKEVGKGTGMGMSVVHGIVKSMKG